MTRSWFEEVRSAIRAVEDGESYPMSTPCGAVDSGPRPTRAAHLAKNVVADIVKAGNSESQKHEEANPDDPTINPSTQP